MNQNFSTNELTSLALDQTGRVGAITLNMMLTHVKVYIYDQNMLTFFKYIQTMYNYVFQICS